MATKPWTRNRARAKWKRKLRRWTARKVATMTLTERGCTGAAESLVEAAVADAAWADGSRADIAFLIRETVAEHWDAIAARRKLRKRLLGPGEHTGTYVQRFEHTRTRMGDGFVWSKGIAPYVPISSVD